MVYARDEPIVKKGQETLVIPCALETDNGDVAGKKALSIRSDLLGFDK